MTDPTIPVTIEYNNGKKVVYDAKIIIFEIYATGLVSMSLCTNIEDTKEIERRANVESPTGISSQWSISEDTHFASGEPNPAPCERGGSNKHYLLSC